MISSKRSIWRSEWIYNWGPTEYSVNLQEPTTGFIYGTGSDDPEFGGLRIAQSLVFYCVLYTVVCLFLFFHGAVSFFYLYAWKPVLLVYKCTPDDKSNSVGHILGKEGW